MGADRVAAADPAPQFAAACAERHPGADVREAPAEALPWKGRLRRRAGAARARVHGRPGQGARDIAGQLRAAGPTDVAGGAPATRADYTGFDDFWVPSTYAAGPAGGYLGPGGEARRVTIREACRAALPEGAFSLDARAWFARGTVPA